uniref:Transcription repressor n=1 Tax=Caenorhabditis tropicalis TaxID=1561998 RepID=A0A1I7UDE3_9PELO
MKTLKSFWNESRSAWITKIFLYRIETKRESSQRTEKRRTPVLRCFCLLTPSHLSPKSNICPSTTRSLLPYPWKRTTLRTFWKCFGIESTSFSSCSKPKDLKRRHQDVLQSAIPTKTFRFNASAKPFVSSSSRPSFNFNVFATPFVSSGSPPIGLRPTAPVFTPLSLSSPEGSYPSTPSSSECPSPTSSGSSTPKTTVSPNPISGGFVFNMGVANAPEPGFYTEKFHLDEDAFLISVIEKSEDRSPKKMREFSPEELQKTG